MKNIKKIWLLIIAIFTLCSVTRASADTGLTARLSTLQPPESARILPSMETNIVPLMNVDLTSTSPDTIKVAGLHVSMNTSHAVLALYVFNGSTLIHVAPPQQEGTYLDFLNNPITLAPNQTIPITIKASLAPVQQTNGSIDISLLHIHSQQPGGEMVRHFSYLQSKTVHLFSVFAEWGQRTFPLVRIEQQPQRDPSTSAVATFALRLSAIGGNVTIPTANHFNVWFTDINTGMIHPATQVLVSLTPYTQSIADGARVDVTVTASLLHADLDSRSMITARMAHIVWSVVGQTPVIQRWGLQQMVSEPTNIFFPAGKKLSLISGHQTQNAFVLLFRASPGDLGFQRSADLIDWSDTNAWQLEVIETMHDGSRIYRAEILSHSTAQMFFRVKQ